MLLAALFLLAGRPVLLAQTGTVTPRDTTSRNWYDTLVVTEPQTAGSTGGEQVALVAYTAVAIPVALALGVLTILPPNAIVLNEDGVARGGTAVSTGFGFGGRDTTKLTWYPVMRLQVEAALIPSRERSWLARSSLMFDARLTHVGRRRLLDLAAAVGPGVSTDFSSVSPYIEGWVGLSNPFGIRYLPFNPGHHYGLRVRVGYDVNGERTWHEIAISASSTFPW